MNDKKMLELAALAAGIEGAWGQEGYIERAEGFIPTGWRRRWDPILNDGDAFRLMVALNLNVFSVSGTAYAMESESDGSDEQKMDHCRNPYAATRLAIVKAAAAIGRKIKEEGK